MRDKISLQTGIFFSFIAFLIYPQVSTGCILRLEPIKNTAFTMNGKDTLNQFRAAGKLVNEWRDTLSYGALGAATAAGWVDPQSMLATMAGREVARAAGWLYDRTPLYVGSRMQVSHSRLTHSANAACFLILTGANLLEGRVAPAAIEMLVGAGCLLAAGGSRAVWNAYRDVMWDYPRKKDDGGTPQTQKLKDGIADLVTSLLPARPEPAAARIATVLPAPKVA